MWANPWHNAPPLPPSLSLWSALCRSQPVPQARAELRQRDREIYVPEWEVHTPPSLWVDLENTGALTRSASEPLSRWWQMPSGGLSSIPNSGYLSLDVSSTQPKLLLFFPLHFVPHHISKDLPITPLLQLRPGSYMCAPLLTSSTRPAIECCPFHHLLNICLSL